MADSLQPDRGPVGCDASISTKTLEEGFLESCLFLYPQSLSARFPLDPQSYQLLTTNHLPPHMISRLNTSKLNLTGPLILSHLPPHTQPAHIWEAQNEPNPIPFFSSSKSPSDPKPFLGKNWNSLWLSILFLHLREPAWCVLRPLSNVCP